MRIDNHSLAEYLVLLFPLFLLIALVGVIRGVAAALAGPAWLISLFSVTAFCSVTVLLAALLIHAKNFGGYTSVIVSAVLLTTWSQIFIILAILLSVATGVENIFTRPEFSIPTEDPHHLWHILGHLTVGVGLESILGAAMGSLFFWMVRKIEPRG